MEQLANALSPNVKPLIIATSATSPLLNYGPGGHQGHGGWAPNPVGHGQFTVPDDKIALGGVIAKLIEKRKAQALREGDLLWYRHLHCLAAGQLNGTGAEPTVPKQGLDEWMKTMRFTTVHDERKKRDGITPLRYAAIGNRPDLVTALLERGADLHGDRVRKPTATMTNQWFVLKNMSVLFSAAMWAPAHDDVSCVRCLLEAGADPLTTCMPPFNMDLLCILAGAEAGEGGCDLIRLAGQYLPKQRIDSSMMLALFSMEMAPLCGKARLFQYQLEHHADFMLADRGPPHHGGRQRLAAICCNHVGSIECLRLALNAGADPNGMPEGAPIYRWAPMRILLPFFRRKALKSKQPSDMVDNVALYDGASPLHVACMKGNIGAVRLLLERGAKLDSTNSGSPNLRMTALTYAAMRGHTSIVEELLSHVAPPFTKRGFALMKDKRGKTASHYANLRGHTHIVELLEGVLASDS